MATPSPLVAAKTSTMSIYGCNTLQKTPFARAQAHQSSLIIPHLIIPLDPRPRIGVIINPMNMLRPIIPDIDVPLPINTGSPSPLAVVVHPRGGRVVKVLAVRPRHGVVVAPLVAVLRVPVARGVDVVGARGDLGGVVREGAIFATSSGGAGWGAVGVFVGHCVGAGWMLLPSRLVG